MGEAVVLLAHGPRMPEGGIGSDAAHHRVRLLGKRLLVRYEEIVVLPVRRRGLHWRGMNAQRSHGPRARTPLENPMRPGVWTVVCQRASLRIGWQVFCGVMFCAGTLSRTGINMRSLEQ